MEGVEPADQRVDLGQLLGQGAPEQTADVAGGEVVAAGADPRRSGSVVAGLGVVERVLHEARERQRAGRSDLASEGFGEVRGRPAPADCHAAGSASSAS